MKAWDANPAVIDKWMIYLQRHSLAGVGMRIVKWERMGLGGGEGTLDEALEKGRREGKTSLTPRERMMALSAKIITEESKSAGVAAKQKQNGPGARGQAKGGKGKSKNREDRG